VGKLSKIVSLLLLVCLLAGCAAVVYYQRSTYVSVGDIRYRRDTAQLSISGNLPRDLTELTRLEKLQLLDLRNCSVSCEEYEELCRVLPRCQIVWNVPFQGSLLSMDTEELTVSTLLPPDILALNYFPRLGIVHAERCTDFSQVQELLFLRPDLDIRYRVPLNGQWVDHDATELTIANGDIPEMLDTFPYLPGLTRVTLTGTLPDADQLRDFTARYPHIEFYWQVDYLDRTLDVHTTELDLSGIRIDSPEELEAAVAYLPRLEKVLMLGCGLSDEEMAQLNARHESVLFVWEVKLTDHLSVRSDITIFAPVLLNTEVWGNQLEKLKYCTELQIIDLGHMKITDCEFLRTMTKLEYLILADTRVQDLSPMENLKSLRYLEIFMTPVSDYSPLVHCTALEDLNLGLTFGAPEPLMQMPWLKRLWWAAHDMTDQQVAQLQAALPDTQIVFPTYGSTGSGWREGYLYYQMRDMMGLPYMTE